MSEPLNGKVSTSSELMQQRPGTRTKKRNLKRLLIGRSPWSLMPSRGKGKFQKKKWITKEKKSCAFSVASQATWQTSILKNERATNKKGKGPCRGSMQQRGRPNSKSG